MKKVIKMSAWANRSERTRKNKVDFRDGGYRKLRLRNYVTGEREDVLLLNPHKMCEDESLEFLIQDPMVELKIDVSQALRSFSPIEQRIIIRVLVQGQSVEEATKHLKKSARRWRLWFDNVALPRLRESLKDYYEPAVSALELAGKVVA